jgi:predicted Zn-dependent protease
MQPPNASLQPWFRKPQFWIAVCIFICLGFLSMPYVRRVYYQWTGVKKVRRAVEALERNDFQTAILNGKGALATNPHDLEALRIMAKTAEKMGAPQNLEYRLQIEAIAPRDGDNLLGMAEAHLKAGSITAAEEALKNLPAADREIARYHDVAAAIAVARRDSSAAEAHAEEASRLAPTDDNYQLKLAILQLSAESGESRAGALQALRVLAAKPTMRMPALRALHRDAESHGDWEHALEFANAIGSSRDASFADKLLLLSTLSAQKDALERASGLRGIDESAFWTALNRLRELAGNKEEQLYQLLSWMNEHHQALLVLEWSDSFPAERLSKPPVCVAVAEACLRSSYWAKLKSLVEKGPWEGREYLRQAFLSRTLGSEGDLGGSATAWNRAMEIAQAQPASLEVLARETMKWGWKGKSEDALWKLTTFGTCPRWVVDTLWDAALKRQDSVALYKASKLVLQAEPKSIPARNHYISLALITEQDGDAAHALAEAHYKEHPDNIAVASTYGLSLFQRDRADEAVAVMSAFPPEQLRNPALAFYQSIFLAGAGRPDEAEEYFRLGQQAPVFSELVEIRNFFRALFEARSAGRSSESAWSSQAWEKALHAAQAQPQWLEILGRITLKWGWTERTGEVAQDLADAGKCPAWAIEPLWTASLRKGDTSQIYKASKLIADANPKSIRARNNFITVALLAGKQADASGRLAEALYQENSSDPEVTVTYAYSLHQQGKGEKALTLLRSLKPEQLQQPRPALYYALLLASNGEPEEAGQFLKTGTTETLLPEEKVIADILNAAIEWRTLEKAGDQQSTAAAWSKTLSAAERRPEMLETLGRMFLRCNAPDKAAEVLWKLSETSGCPRWVLDHLWADAVQRRNSAQLYKLSRLLRRLEPNSAAIRNDYVRLGLLTGQDADFPHRQADSLYDENPGDPQIAATKALSLYQRNRVRDAVALLGGLRPDQLRIPRVAYYYGILLVASGQAAQAQEYLRIGGDERLLPEEEDLLGKAKTASVQAKATP